MHLSHKISKSFGAHHFCNFISSNKTLCPAEKVNNYVEQIQFKFACAEELGKLAAYRVTTC